MRKLPTTPSSLFRLIKTIIIAYPAIFPQIIGLVAISSLAHLVIPPLFIQNPAFAGVAFVGFVLLTWFLYTAIICRANIALLGGHLTLKQSFRLAKQRFLYVLGSNIIFFVIGVFVLLAEFALQLAFDLLRLHPVYLFISIIIDVIIFVYLYFAIPEIALEHTSILEGFKKSVRLVKTHWWRTFIILALISAMILGVEALGILFTGKSRLLLFTGFHFLQQLIFYPLIISATVVLLNDLKLRQEGIAKSNESAPASTSRSLSAGSR